MRNYFTLDGVDSRNFGVYISGQGTFSAPARAYEMLPVPGKNGDLVGTETRFENGELTYPAFIYANFKQNIADFRAFINSLFGYHRLVDSYHPNEYRMVFFQGEFAPDVTAKNDAASFDITFNCKPQRFLLSGEEVVTLDVNDPPSETFSGNPATFEADGEYPIADLSVAIEPIQDLNGYDNPWPAGGGKNKLPYPYYGASGTINGITYTVNADGSILLNGTASARSVFYLSNHATKVSPPSGSYILSKASTSNYPNLVIDAYNGNSWVKQLTISAINDPVAFTLDYDGYDRIEAFLSVSSGETVSNKLVKPMIRLSSVTDATFAPYSNICPISGWDGVNVTRTGINVWDEEWEPGLLNSDGSVSSGARVTSKNYIPVVPNKTYCFSLPDGFYAAGRGAYYDADKNLVQYLGDFPTKLSHGGDRQFALITVPANASYLKFCINGAYGPTYNNDISINYPSTDTDYHSGADNTTYSIAFPSSAGTVYGGTLDVTTGKLTVDRAMVDLGTLAWSYTTNWNGAPAFYSGAVNSCADVSNTNVNTICSTFKAVSGDALWSGKTLTSIIALPTEKRFYVRDNRFSTAADFKTAVTGQTASYPLATPIVIDNLDPVTVSTLLGTNNVWADTGAVEGKYVMPFTIENPTRYNSQPLLRVYGAGNLGINGDTITISQADGYTDIDCELMDAFKGLESRNQYVTLTNYKFPVLVPGENGIALGSGITRVEITPRWWTI